MRTGPLGQSLAAAVCAAGGGAGRDQGQCGRGATKRKKSEALHSGNLLRRLRFWPLSPASRTAPMTAEPPAAAADAPRPLARLAARQGRDPGAGAALHPQVPRQDDRHQVRRQRDDRPGAAAGLRRGRRAAEAGRHEPGRRARRRAADRGGARQDRQEGHLHPGHARHRRRDDGGRRVGARRPGAAGHRRPDQRRRRQGGRPDRAATAA